MMGKRQSRQKRKGRKKQRQKRKRSMVASPTAATDMRWRNAAIIGGTIVTLLIVGALIVVNLGSASKEHDPFQGIQGGITKEGFPYLGSLDADVVLTEFTDFYCSHCRDYVLESAGSILVDYVATGQVRYVLHHYSNGSAQSLQATDAAMCAADQDLYFQFQHAFFENPVTTREGFLVLGRDLGLDEEEFLACWDAGQHRETLVEHIQAARTLGVSGTPSFQINNQMVVGNRADLVRQTIEDELAAD
ncbi:MAG: thioredoxin domain-containing protein [Chloroflexi bacterium]|nr:thioredoxin domain-containing protein [Chloroflexota bacterium]